MEPFRSKKRSESINRPRRNFLRLATCLPAATLACSRNGPPGLTRGMPFPALELPVLDGDSLRLGDVASPRLINFWATWCLPCRAEMASLNRLYQDYATRGLSIYAVSVDEDSHLVREYLRKSPLAFAVLLDVGGRAASGLGVTAYPTTLLVDRHEKVSGIWVGDQNWDAADIRATIDQFL